MSGDPDSSSRTDHRFRLAVPATLVAGDRELPCEAQNLSRSGTLLVGNLPRPEGETVELSLKAPYGHLTIHLSGRVIRVEPGADGQTLRIALTFVDMDAGRRDELEVLLSRLLATPAAGPLDGLKPGAGPQEVKKALESIPLAQRIALACRASAKEREHLRSDTNPAVLEALAHNASLTLAEARLLAASSYLIPGTLDALAQDQRFRADDELRMAIAVHPKVSVATAERVTADLKLPNIKLLLAKPGLSQHLRDKLVRRTRRA